MVYLPARAWDMSLDDRPGHLFVFLDKDEQWRGLRLFRDGSPPEMIDYGDDLGPCFDRAVLRRGGREVPAQNFRINWRSDGKISVVQIGCRGAK